MQFEVELPTVWLSGPHLPRGIIQKKQLFQKGGDCQSLLKSWPILYTCWYFTQPLTCVAALVLVLQTSISCMCNFMLCCAAAWFQSSNIVCCSHGIFYNLLKKKTPLVLAQLTKWFTVDWTLISNTFNQFIVVNYWQKWVNQQKTQLFSFSIMHEQVCFFLNLFANQCILNILWILHDSLCKTSNLRV